MAAYDYAHGCSGGPQPGTIELQNYILNQFSDSKSGGIYACRRVRGSTTATSLHAEGRAVDIVPAKAMLKTQGDSIAAWALNSASAWGIQEIIWNRHIWSSLYPSSGWRAYNGVNPHTDHVHIGQTRAAAAGTTGISAEAAGIGIGGLIICGLVGWGVYYWVKHL